MKEIPLNFVRELKFEIEGKALEGKLSIRSLNLNTDKNQWECHWSLDHLYPDTVSFAGDDPLEALTRTLMFASEFIRGSNQDGHKVFWRYEGDNAGLPLRWDSPD